MKFFSLKNLMGWSLLVSLLLVSACATGTGGKPAYQLTPQEQEEQNPIFWQMWQDLRGVGG
jgi:hypothetical protein|uniref:Lipoprotein n=1 Tax=Desulfobacca acetoxidans TaxID=60893 RepID=A0A7C3Z8Y5_9BACT